jgi:Rieske Fe-S protein
MKNILNPVVLIGSLVVALLLVVGMILMLGPINRSAPGLDQVEAVITVIPNPTSTPTSTPTQPAPTATPAANDAIQTGAFVKIQGTGGEGLRLRAEPSLSASTNYVGLEDEVFRVLEGPEAQDGYQWWLLEAPASASRNGWAVSNYLAVAQGP